MKISLETFREKLTGILLEYSWNEWASLGIPSHSHPASPFVDPEALLLFSFPIARYDARLFDEILGWLNANGDLISIQRMRNLWELNTEIKNITPLLSAAAEYLSKTSRNRNWKGIITKNAVSSEKAPLFYSIDGSPQKQFTESDPVFLKYGFERGVLHRKSETDYSIPKTVQNLLFILRSLFGVGARSEIILYLMTHEQGIHPSKIAREIHYSQKTIQDLLVSMSSSGMVLCRKEGKEKKYYLQNDKWFSFFGFEDLNSRIRWEVLSCLLPASLELWQFSGTEKLKNADCDIQNALIREKSIFWREIAFQAGFGMVLSDEKLYKDKNLLEVLLNDLGKVFAI